MSDKSTKLEVIKATSIAELTIALLMRKRENGCGYSNGEIAAMIKRDVKGSNTSPACVAWYRSHMKNAGFAAKHGVTNYVPLIVKRMVKEVTVTIESSK